MHKSTRTIDFMITMVLNKPAMFLKMDSKLLELFILENCKEAISTSDTQFGFKENHSTDMCVFTKKEVVQYYVSLGSPIYLSFMDARKAFDKVNHWHLLDKLLNHGIPLCLVRVLLFWFSSQDFIVNWNNLHSNSFKVTNGVSQGGILSPSLFAVYVDALSKSLNQSNVGCHFYSICVNHYLCYIIVLITPCLLHPLLWFLNDSY